MAKKALRLKGTNTIVRYDDRYAAQDRFEQVEVSEGKIVEKKAAKKKVAKKKAAKKKAVKKEAASHAIPPEDDSLDDLIAGLSDVPDS
jgi:hypothetical protein